MNIANFTSEAFYKVYILRVNNKNINTTIYYLLQIKAISNKNPIKYLYSISKIKFRQLPKLLLKNDLGFELKVLRIFEFITMTYEEEIADNMIKSGKNTKFVNDILDQSLENKFMVDSEGLGNYLTCDFCKADGNIEDDTVEENNMTIKSDNFEDTSDGIVRDILSELCDNVCVLSDSMCNTKSDIVNSDKDLSCVGKYEESDNNSVNNIEFGSENEISDENNAKSQENNSRSIEINSKEIKENNEDVIENTEKFEESIVNKETIEEETTVRKEKSTWKSSDEDLVKRRNVSVRKRRKEKEKRVSFNLDEELEEDKKITHQKVQITHSKSLPNLQLSYPPTIIEGQISNFQENCDCIECSIQYSREDICDCCNYDISYSEIRENDIKHDLNETLSDDLNDFKENINNYVSSFSKDESTSEEENNNNLKNAYRNSYVLDDAILNLPIEYRDTSRNRDSLYSLSEYEEYRVEAINNSLLDEEVQKEEDEFSIIDEEKETELISSSLEKDSGIVSSSLEKDSEIVGSSLETHDEDTKKRKKKKSFLSIFGKKNKEKTIEIQPSPQKSLQKSRKYSSAIDISDKSLLTRTPSFIKRLTKISNDATSKLKRSFSYRDLNKSRETIAPSPIKMLDKTSEWAKSLQNLIENDVSVSYNDLSFVNYDVLNTVSYDEPKKHLWRTQSWHVQVST